MKNRPKRETSMRVIKIFFMTTLIGSILLGIIYLRLLNDSSVDLLSIFSVAFYAFFISMLFSFPTVFVLQLGFQWLYGNTREHHLPIWQLIVLWLVSVAVPIGILFLVDLSLIDDLIWLILPYVFTSLISIIYFTKKDDKKYALEYSTLPISEREDILDDGMIF